MKAIIFSTVLLVFTFSLNSQNVSKREKDRSFFDRLSLKANAEISGISLSPFKGMSREGKSWVFNYGGSVNYEISNRFSLEAEYKYVPGFNYTQEPMMLGKMNGTAFERYTNNSYSDFSSHLINLKANYFISEERRIHPIYFIGGISIALQPVTNTVNDVYVSELGSIDRSVETTAKYNRYLVGPMAGIGVFYDLGFISFATELSFAARVSVVNDKKLTETAFNLNFSPILKF